MMVSIRKLIRWRDSKQYLDVFEWNKIVRHLFPGVGRATSGLVFGIKIRIYNKKNGRDIVSKRQIDFGVDNKLP